MASHDPQRPNLIVIISDDQGHWALNCAGTRELRTPNLDRFAATGLRFENLFCVSPVCSAARASILTGGLPSQHGVHDFLRGGADIPGVGGDDLEYLQGHQTYTELLAAAGYVCGLSGKWHLGMPMHAQKGFSFWRAKTGNYMDCPVFDGRGTKTEMPGYATDHITDFALQFLETQRRTAAPFYLHVCYNAPHSPWERTDHPAALWDEYFHNGDPASVPYGPKHPQDAGITDFFDSEKRRREKVSGYFAAITAMDAGIGRLVAWLDAAELRENTLLVFTSDNGMNMGHHGICGKGNGTLPVNLFDTSVKVPGIVSQPGRVPARVATGLYSHYDLMPTLLGLAGVANPRADRLPGRSLAALLRGGPEPADAPVVVFDEYGPVRMIRTGDWKYVHRYQTGQHELYDLVNDPGETRNLYGDGLRARALRGELQAWFDRYADPRLDGAKLPVTGCGQLRLATEPDAFAQSWPPEWRHVSLPR